MTTPIGEACVVLRQRIYELSTRLKIKPPRLVAVSKTKPVEMLMQAYDAEQRAFGENYVQELVDKAPRIGGQMPPDVQWHFIGHLQSNKVKALVAGVPNLSVIETVDSEKLASLIDKEWKIAARDRPLNVMVQVNTSEEDSKSGLAPEEAVRLSTFIHERCPSLHLMGLMTMGFLDTSAQSACFQKLRTCRTLVGQALEICEESLELSMGTSSDFELAIEMGSTSVRVGTTIFGAREYPKK